MPKLIYEGKQYMDLKSYIRLWTLNLPGHPYHLSTMSINSLKELNIITDLRGMHKSEEWAFK